MVNRITNQAAKCWKSKLFLNLWNNELKKNHEENTCLGNVRKDFLYNFSLFSFQTVNKVLIVYADVVKQDFEKYTNDHKKVSPQAKYMLFNINI